MVSQLKNQTTDERAGKEISSGTTSTSTGQVVHGVTKGPLKQSGASIVSTKQETQSLSDAVVAPEEVGGTVNEIRFISVADRDGKLKTLPNTGTASILDFIRALIDSGWLLLQENVQVKWKESIKWQAGHGYFQ